MKVRSVRVNARRKGFDVAVGRRTLPFPFAKADPVPDAADPVVRAYVDPEIAREGFVYVLASGAEGTVHVEQVLDYNRDPDYLRGILLHRLTVEAARRLEASGLAKREVIRRLGTSPAQLYRLLDPTDRRKSVDAMLALLQVLDCDVDVVVNGRTL
mgnify:CR=1 FL=1